jgi:hypothetical protein
LFLGITLLTKDALQPTLYMFGDTIDMVGFIGFDSFSSLRYQPLPPSWHQTHQVTCPAADIAAFEAFYIKSKQQMHCITCYHTYLSSGCVHMKVPLWSRLSLAPLQKAHQQRNT